MQRFGVENHHIDKDIILLTFKRKNAYEKENDFIYGNCHFDNEWRNRV